MEIIKEEQKKCEMLSHQFFALVMYITNYETIYENEKWDDYD